MPTTVTINPDLPDEFSVREIVRCLRAGGIIIYPTETFYGIGALFTRESTLKRLFAIKQRDAGKPVLLLIPDVTFIRNISSVVPPALETLAEYFWPGPLTLLIEALPHLSPLITGHNRTVGIRISSSTSCAAHTRSSAGWHHFDQRKHLWRCKPLIYRRNP